MSLLPSTGHLIPRAHSWAKTRCWEGLRAGGEGVAEDEMVSITNSVDMNLRKLQEREAWQATVHGVSESDPTWRLSSSCPLRVHGVRSSPCAEVLSPHPAPRRRGSRPLPDHCFHSVGHLQGLHKLSPSSSQFYPRACILWNSHYLLINLIQLGGKCRVWGFFPITNIPA